MMHDNTFYVEYFFFCKLDFKFKNNVKKVLFNFFFEKNYNTADQLEA